MSAPEPPPLTLGKAAAAARIGVSRATFDRLRQRVRGLEPVDLGTHALRWRVEDLDRWLAGRRADRRPRKSPRKE